ncbi:MAG: transporter substrate-binding domain-containing diguanylate cyclase [Eubacteriales bacterium]
MKKFGIIKLLLITVISIIPFSTYAFADVMDTLSNDKFELVNANTPNVVREKKLSHGKVVKVGWFSSAGVHQTDADGTLSGYDYEWLQAIAQYNNWNYEYHFGSFAECLQWLKDGKIDLIGIMNKTAEREEFLDFSRINVGIEQCCIFANKTDSQFEYENFHNFNNMLIGVEEGTTQAEMLKLYAQNNHFDYRTKVFPTLSDAQVSLKNKEIDALLASNTDVIRGFKTIAQFNPIPFYFATTKGNLEVLTGINYAMDKIMTYNPNFNNFLYSKYFTQSSSEKTVFSTKELEYIKKHPKILVLVDPFWFPIESVNEMTGSFNGIIPNILNEIESRSGLKFSYVNSKSSVGALEQLSAQTYSTIPTITSISFDYKWANENNVNITQPIISTPIQMVQNSKKHPKTVALVSHDYITNMVKIHYPNLKPLYYESMRDCVNAVHNGKADITFMNDLEAQYYLSLNKFHDLHFSNINAFDQHLCLGISKNSNPLLFSIISKCLQDIPASTVQDIMIQNIYISNNVTLSDFAKSHVTELTVFTILIFAIAIAWMYVTLRARTKASNAIALENKKFNQLSEISNEHIFEYDYKTDILTFKNATSPLIFKYNPFYNYSKFISNSNFDYENTLYSCLAEKTDLIRDINYEYTNGIKNWLRVTTKIVNDETGTPAYAIGKLQNVQSEHEELELLIKQATMDSLTHILNSKSFKKSAESNMRLCSALALFDIDHFKSINDKYGHLSGDFVLVEFAKALNSVFSKHGFAGRIGGDEFAVFIPNKLTKEETVDLCRKIMNTTKKIQFKFKGVTVSPVNISMGVSFLQKNQTFKDLYENADRMLYTVKENGRNGFKIDFPQDGYCYNTDFEFEPWHISRETLTSDMFNIPYN